MTPTKRCSRCGEEFPATLEYFHKDKDKKDGLATFCKECKRASTQSYRSKNADKAKASQRRSVAKRQDYYSEKLRQYRQTNKDRLRETYRLYYKENRERILERVRSYYFSNRQKKLDYAKWYKRRNASKIQAWKSRNHDKIKATMRAYAKENQEKRRVNETRRRARKANADGNLTALNVKQQYDRQKGKCYWCGCKVNNDFHVDHIVPLSRGGANDPDNIVIACPPCNMSKHNKLPHEWPQGNRLL